MCLSKFVQKMECATKKLIWKIWENEVLKFLCAFWNFFHFDIFFNSQKSGKMEKNFKISLLLLGFFHCFFHRLHTKKWKNANPTGSSRNMMEKIENCWFPLFLFGFFGNCENFDENCQKMEIFQKMSKWPQKQSWFDAAKEKIVWPLDFSLWVIFNISHQIDVVRMPWIPMLLMGKWWWWVKVCVRWSQAGWWAIGCSALSIFSPSLFIFPFLVPFSIKTALGIPLQLPLHTSQHFHFPNFNFTFSLQTPSFPSPFPNSKFPFHPVPNSNSPFSKFHFPCSLFPVPFPLPEFPIP